jgi:hypothetical protein
MAMTRTIHGTIRGRTIELREDIGLRDGQDVEVQVTPVVPPRPWGEGIRRSAGCMADDPDFDAVMSQVHRAR